MININNKIHDKLKTYRKMQGMTLDNVAKEIGVNKTTIQRYESGAIPNIPIETIKALSTLYGVSVNEMLSIESKESEMNSFVELIKELGFKYVTLPKDKTAELIRIKTPDGNHYELTHNDLIGLKADLQDYLSFQLFKLSLKK